MSQCCNSNSYTSFDGASKAYKRVLMAVIVLNLSMFIVEVIGGMRAASMSLLADSLDFLGDSLTYLISFMVIGMALSVRAKAGLFKGVSLLLIAGWILGGTIHRLFILETPEAFTMGSIALLALAANVISALLLFNFRSGDSNVTSVWLCSRNDAIGNLAVLLAALGIFASDSPWPDLIVALIMVGLFMHSAGVIIRQSLSELGRAGQEQQG